MILLWVEQSKGLMWPPPAGHLKHEEVCLGKNEVWLY